MNNHKRILSLILALILSLSPFTTAFAQTEASAEETRIAAQEVQIGDEIYYIFSTDKNAKNDLIKSQEKSQTKTEEIQTSDGLELSDNLFGGPVGAGETTSYTLNFKGTNFKGVGGKTFDWNTLPKGLELQVWYLDENGLDVNVGNPIVINESNYQDTITRTFDIAGTPLAFGLKSNIDNETYLTDVYLSNVKSPDPWAASLNATFDLVQVPSTKLSVKWVDVNHQPLAKDKTPSTNLKDTLTFNFIANRKFDLPNQDKEDPYFRLVNKIPREKVKDMEGATPLVDDNKDGEVTLDGKTYKLTTSYDPAYNEGSKIQLMFMPDVIDRTKNPDAETPKNYVRVTIDAGEGTKLAEGETKKVYDVRVGKVLKAEHYPKLELKEGHKDPITWTIAPETAINKKADIVGNAAKTAAQTITAENLAPVDTTALQGQDLDEKFWHDGVALADGVEEAKKTEFEALLKEATVTDLSNRTSAKVEDQVGKLLVTFKDGSTLEVPNQKLIVKPNTVTVAFDKAKGKEHPLRDGDTTVKGTISASSNTDEFPVSLDGALVTIKKGDTVLSRTLANADGSFVAGVKDPLVAGEEISVVVTLPESKTESEPVTETVQLNPDKLNEIIPTGNEVVKNFEDKQGVNQEKVTALKNAIKKATDDLVETDGKVKAGVTVDAKGQKSLDDQYEAIKKAIEALTGNSAPEITGPASHKEIFKGDALNLEDGITVTDKDGETDIVKDGEKAFTYTVEKVDAKGNKTKVEDTTTIKDTAGTYEVTYTAKDKSGAEGKFVMTLVVKEPVVEIKDNFPEVIPEGYVKVEFKPGDHGTLEGTTKFLVKDGSAKTVLNVPTIKPNANYEAKKDANWEPAIPDTFKGTEENKKSFTFTAQYAYTGKDVVEQKPGDKKPDVPDNFVKVEFKKGDHGVISSEYTTIYWVNPDANKTLADIKKPAVTALEGYKFTGWDKEDSEAIGVDGLTVTAQYKEKVVEGKDQPNKPGTPDGQKDPDPDYVKLTFNAGDNGKFAENAETTIWVLKNEDVKFNAPAVEANDGFVFNGWEPELLTKYTEDKTHTAKYEPKSNISDVPVAGFQEVKFLPGTGGKFEGDKTEKSVWVRPEVEVDLTAKAPKVIANEGKVHSGWSQELIGTFTKSDTPTEITAQYKTDADNNGIADEDETTATPTVTARNIGENPTTTTVEGTAPKGSTVTIKYPVDGQETTKTVTAGADGKYTAEIEPKLPVDTEVKVTAKDGEKKESLPAKTKVFDDKDKDGQDDRLQDFDIKKVTNVEVIQDPTKMDYLVGAKDGKTPFETAGLVIKLTDSTGKEVKYTAEELKGMDGITIEPADGTEIGLDKNNTKLKVTVTGSELAEKPTAESKNNITVKLDADGNGIADEDEKSEQAKDVKALNQNKVDPETNEVTDQPKDTTTVTGKAKPGSTVIIKDETGNEIGKVDSVPENGEFTAEVTKQDEGKKVQVVVTEPGKQDSDPVEATVVRDSDNDGEDDSKAGQTERPAAIASNKGKNPTFTTIEGKTEKGATITVTVKENGEEKPVTVENLNVKDDGTYTLEAKYNGKPLENGAEILVYAQNKPKTISEPQTTTVFNDANEDGKPDGGKVDLKDVKDIQVIAPDKMSYTQGEKLVGTGLKAVVRDNAGNIEIFDYDNEAGKFKDADGNEVVEITATVADKAIKDLALTEKDHDGKAIDVKVGDKTGSTNQKLEVKQLQTPTPTIEFAANQNTVGSDGSTPTGTAKQKTTVKFTVKNKPTTVYVKYTVNGEDQEETFEIGANDELTKTVDLSVKLPVGAEVQVRAKDADKLISDVATKKVVRDANNDGTADDKTPVGKTEIDPIKAESENITVKPADNATELVIKETDKSGNTPTDSKQITVTKDEDGNWKIGDDIIKPDKDGKLTIPTKDKLNLDEYNVVEVDASGDPDTTTPSNARETVGEAADTTAPDMPVVDQPVDGDKDIMVKTPTEKDAKTITVEVEVPAKPGEDPTTKTVVVTKDNDGKWKTPDGKEVPEENGKLVIPVDPAVKTGDKVAVEVKDETGNANKTEPQEVIARQQLPEPTIEPIKTGEKTVAGTAENASTVDIYKKNADGGYDLIKEGVAVGADGSYTYNNVDGFKDGDVIRVVAKRDGWTPNNAETTVGVDTSGLDKAITDGKGELDKRNDGTPADKALEEAIKEGEDLKKRDPAPSQEEVNKAKDKIEKAIEDKKAYDDAKDKLKEKIKEAEDKKNDPEYDSKPDYVKEELDKSATDGQTTHDNKDSSKDDIDKAIEKIQEKIDQYNKQQIGVNINKVNSSDKTVVVTVTARNANVKVYKSEFDFSTRREKLTLLGETTDLTRILIVSLEETLPSGTNLLIKVTHPDYLSYENTVIVE